MEISEQSKFDALVHTIFGRQTKMLPTKHDKTISDISFLNVFSPQHSLALGPRSVFEPSKLLWAIWRAQNCSVPQRRRVWLGEISPGHAEDDQSYTFAGLTFVPIQTLKKPTSSISIISICMPYLHPMTELWGEHRVEFVPHGRSASLACWRAPVPQILLTGHRSGVKHNIGHV